VGATFDARGRYRWRLWRTLGASPDRVLFVMLNPSTADADRDDPTIRRCIGFARAWGFGRLDVVNLFAFRTALPGRLRGSRDPVGPDNDRHIARAARDADAIVAAWGVHGALLRRDRAVLDLLADRPLLCLGRTRAGHPRHPLYLRAATHPVPLVSAG
jgi:hypothetical protein